MKHPVSVARRATAAAAARLLAAPTRARQIAAAGGHARGRTPLTRSQALAFVGILMMLGTLVAPVGGAIAAPASSSGPPGLEKAPSDNFQAHQSAGPPSHALENVPTHASAWDVHASAHADDLETTVDATGSELRLILSDDRNHAGREVAIAATALEDSLGERPEMAFGVHESGDRWSSEIEYRDGYAVFEVPKFSSNEITFSGEVQLAGNPATDGATYQYDLEDSEDVGNFTVDLTGSNSTQWDNTSLAGRNNGESFSVSVDGSAAARGPASGSPELSITGSGPDQRWATTVDNGIWSVARDGQYLYVGTESGTVSKIDRSDGSIVWTYDGFSNYVMDLAVGSNQIYAGIRDTGELAALSPTGELNWNTTLENTAPGIHGVAWNGTHAFAGGGASDVYVVDDTGTKVDTWGSVHSDIIESMTVESGTLYSTGADQTAVATDTADGTEVWSYAGLGNNGRDIAHDGTNAYVGTANTTDELHVLEGTGSKVWGYDLTTDNAGIKSVAVNGSDVFIGTGHPDKTLRLLDGSNNGAELWSVGYSGNVNSLNAGATDVDVGAGDNDARRVTYVSEDISIAVDGTTELSHSGRLDYGSTSSTAIDLGTGSHSVDVTVTGAVDVDLKMEEVTETIDPVVEINGDNYQYAGVLADGETTSLDVSTTSLQTGTNAVNISVSTSYDGPIGQVGLDYSHTATDAQSVDYSGETFSERYNVSKTYASARTGETLSIPWSGNVIDVRNLEMRRDGGSWTTPSYSLADGVLEVEIGDVAEGETVEIRTTGSKVDTRNGEITVVDPTILGEELSAKIRIDQYSSGFEIATGATITGNETHYTHSESWTNPQTYARIGSDGSQALRFPNAGAGETARISTIPLEPTPQDGHVDLRVLSSGSEPEFEVLDSSSTSEVELLWHNTISGHVYQLYSLDADRERDRGEAASPVLLTHDGTAETLQIIDLGTGGSGGSAGGSRGTADGGILSGPITMIIAVTAALSALYLLSRRTGDDSVSGRFIILLAVPIIGAVAIFALAPQIWSDELASALGDALPLIAMFAAVGVYLWYRAARAPDEQVTLRLGGE